MSLERVIGELTASVRMLEAQVYEVRQKVGQVEERVLEMFNHQSERLAELEQSRSWLAGWKVGAAAVLGSLVVLLQVLTLARQLGLW